LYVEAESKKNEIDLSTTDYSIKRQQGKESGRDPGESGLTVPEREAPCQDIGNSGLVT